MNSYRGKMELMKKRNMNNNSKKKYTHFFKGGQCNISVSPWKSLLWWRQFFCSPFLNSMMTNLHFLFNFVQPISKLLCLQLLQMALINVNHHELIFHRDFCANETNPSGGSLEINLLTKISVDWFKKFNLDILCHQIYGTWNGLMFQKNL